MKFTINFQEVRQKKHPSKNGVTYCRICGAKTGNIKARQIFPARIFRKTNNVVILCDCCYRKLQKLYRDAENQILKEQKETYLLVNYSFLEKKFSYFKRIRIRINSTLSIKINPSQIENKEKEIRFKKRKIRIKCQKCGKTIQVCLTGHHILKISVFGENDEEVDLCIDCHKEIEKIIEYLERRILENFEELYLLILNSLLERKINFSDNKDFEIEIREVNKKYLTRLK